MHAATFGGNPIAAVAGVAALQMIDDEGLLAKAQTLSDLFKTRLEALKDECEHVREVRIAGLTAPGSARDCEHQQSV